MREVVSLGKVGEKEAAKLNLAAHAAVRALPEHDRAPLPAPANGRDLSQASVQPAGPMVGPDYGKSSCPIAPRRCPFGGACHTCPARVQAKLVANAPGDKYEQEADRLADSLAGAAGSQASVLGSSRGPALDSRASSMVHEALAGHGQPLDTATRAELEPRLGSYLGGVRLHTDPTAAQAAASIGAHAFTVGQDIAFAAARYDPSTGAGRNLLVHELVHTVQQQAWPGAAGLVMGRWEATRGSECSDVGRRWLRRVVVEQEMPQSVTLYWNDGTTEADECSTGKGLCCVDPSSSEGAAGTVRGSSVSDTNLTPITEGAGYPVVHRDHTHAGNAFWSEFVPGRHIALHAYDDKRVNGTPLSHGCVRLHKNTARRIFCGVRQNQTMVQVRGFARPMCDDPALQGEWRRDFATGGADLSKWDGHANIQRTIVETREALSRALGRTLSPAEIARLTVADIPRCGATGRRPNAEEQRAAAFVPPPQPADGVPVVTPGAPSSRILAASRFGRFLPPFQAALARARNLAGAHTAVQTHGRALWQAAVARAQAARADTDDRPLYWARLELTRALRQWQPVFALSDPDRQALIDLLERTSRGMDTASFNTRNPNVKRILICGFDPFDLDETPDREGRRGDRRHGNPSGAAVLALDRLPFRAAGITAEIQGVIFPVRYADFDAGIVETTLRPFLTGSPPVNMILSISQGRSQYEIEEYAGRRRSRAGFADNAGQTTLGTPARPVEPGGLAPGSEFLRTNLPTAAMRGALGRPNALPEESEIAEIPAGRTAPVTRTSGGPTAGSTSVEGSGRSFLSNEIFYRESLLRSTTSPDVRVGHLHVPAPADLPGTEISDAAFIQRRDEIVDRVRDILRAVLPQI